jgi:hypothetical protein
VEEKEVGQENLREEHKEPPQPERRLISFREIDFSYIKEVEDEHS